jgi:hypothetical protein
VTGYAKPKGDGCFPSLVRWTLTLGATPFLDKRVGFGRRPFSLKAFGGPIRVLVLCLTEQRRDTGHATTDWAMEYRFRRI